MSPYEELFSDATAWERFNHLFRHDWCLWIEMVGWGSKLLRRSCGVCGLTEYRTVDVPHVHQWGPWTEIRREDLTVRRDGSQSRIGLCILQQRNCTDPLCLLKEIDIDKATII